MEVSGTLARFIAESRWEDITPAQLADPATKALLNKLRRDVCGGEDFYK